MQTQTVLTVPLTTQFPTHLTLEQLIQNLTAMASASNENAGGSSSSHTLSQGQSLSQSKSLISSPAFEYF